MPSSTNSALQVEIAKRAELQEQLIKTARQAGMAEVATGVLHNVGNVLNSMNVSANLVMENLKTSRVASLAKASEAIAEHRDDLAAFLTSNERGRHLPEFLSELATRLADERDLRINELRELIEHVEHVKEIVNMQQAYAHMRGTTEPVNLVELVEDALKINNAGMLRHGVTVVTEFADTPPVVTEKHKVLQILVNLISNAKYALSDSERDVKTMTLKIGVDEDRVRVEVSDNGVGIPKENLKKIFAHGFTTKKEGHGFGLHSSGLAAQELGGTLSVHSDGPGRGATFTLRIPMEAEMPCKT